MGNIWKDWKARKQARKCKKNQMRDTLLCINFMSLWKEKE